MNQTVSPDRLLESETLLIVFMAIIFSIALSVAYSFEVLSLGGIIAIVILFPLLWVSFLKAETLLLIFIGAYFGFSYFTNDLIIAGILQGIFLAFIGSILFIKRTVSGKNLEFKTPLNKILFLWLIVVFLSFCYGVYRENQTIYIFADLYKFVAGILAFWLTVAIIREKKQISFFIWGLLILFAILGIVDIVLFFSRVQAYNLLEFRVREASQDTSIFGVMFATPLILKERKISTKLFLYSLVTIYFLSFLLAFFRTGYIALSLGLISIVFFYSHKSKSKFLTLLKTFFFMLILIVFFASATIFLEKNYNVNLFGATVARFGTILGYKEVGGIKERFSEMESIAFRVLAKRPILGNGLGAEYYALSMSTGALVKKSAVTSAHWGMKHYVHNNIFEIFLRTGLLGGFVFLTLLFRYCRNLLQFYLKTEGTFSQRVLLGIIGVLVSSLILSINNPLLLSPFIGMCAALTYSIAKIEDLTQKRVFYGH